MRHPMLQVAIEINRFNLRKPLPEPIAQRAHPLVFSRHLLAGDSKGLSHAHNLVGGQRARAHAALMATAMDLRFDTNAGLAAYIKRADPLGAIGFMGRE